MIMKMKKNEKGVDCKIKKSLALYPFNQKFPSIYESTIEFFSKEYTLIYSPWKWSKFYRLKENRLIRNSYYFIMNTIRKRLKPNFLKEGTKIDSKKDLLFCFNQLPPSEFEFIIELETVVGFSNYDYSKLDKEYISKRLEDEKCKGILCWNQTAYNELTKTIDCSKFKKKINVIPFGGDNSKLRKKQHKNFNFLFVSSINNPISFKTKGGLIALETYSKLAKKYKNINFYVRANIDKEIIKKYKNVPGLIFLEKYLTEEKMQNLFSTSDLLLVPIPGIDLFIKCMEFGIPSVCLDYGVAYEMVLDKKTGFLIKSSKIFKDREDIEAKHKNETKYYKLLSQERECFKFVPEFVEKCEVLIKDRDLLKKMIKDQHSLVEDNGKYSLKKRNDKLKKLIDPTLIWRKKYAKI